MATLYHYTNALAAISILKGKPAEAGSALSPRRNIGVNGVWEPKAIFALTSPTPPEWVNNKTFPQAWTGLVEYFMRYALPPILLEINTIPTDTIQVVDYAILHAIHASTPLERVPFRYRYTKEDEARKLYLGEAVSLQRYQDDPEMQVYFSLPEVHILNPIPYERVIVSAQQPLVEETLKMPDVDDEIAQRILEGTLSDHLRPWIEGYTARTQTPEYVGRSKEIA